MGAVLNYAIKKLIKAELIKGEKIGKEMFYSTTDLGAELCEKYREIREQCLLDSLKHINTTEDELSEIASALRTISGLYDQASRSASSL